MYKLQTELTLQDMVTLRLLLSGIPNVRDVRQELARHLRTMHDIDVTAPPLEVVSVDADALFALAKQIVDLKVRETIKVNGTTYFLDDVVAALALLVPAEEV